MNETDALLKLEVPSVLISKTLRGRKTVTQRVVLSHLTETRIVVLMDSRLVQFDRFTGRERGVKEDPRRITRWWIVSREDREIINR